VSGVRYRRQVELSTALSDVEKTAALLALERMLSDIGSGRASDFRMIIRGQQRATHSDSEKVSGRAKELRDKGFYFLKYHPKGSKPATYGTSCLKILNAGKRTLHLTLLIFAVSHCWQLVQKAVRCLTHSVELEQHLLPRETLAGSQ